MGRGTHRHMTCWVPYGDISFNLGGLMILEGSHKRMDLLENYIYRDVDAFCENKPKEAEAAKAGKWAFTARSRITRQSYEQVRRALALSRVPSG